VSLTAGSLVSAVAYPAWLEPRWLDVTHTTVSCESTRGNPVRILHMSDLHASVFVPMPMIQHAISLGLQQKPDLICLTGDFVTSKDGFHPEEYIQLLKQLSAAAPTFAVLGNHDGGKRAKPQDKLLDHTLVEWILARSGIHLLHNRSATMYIAGRDLSLAGVGDLWMEEVDAPSAFAELDGKTLTVLLAHNPDSKKALRNFPWHLMLSGHTHGGQVLFPFKGPAYVPVRDKRFVAGLGRWHDRQIYVTRGVGNLGGVRFLCRPEVSVITLA
jgi:predicted MPP superfamily phosphohydrolase